MGVVRLQYHDFVAKVPIPSDIGQRAATLRDEFLDDLEAESDNTTKTPVSELELLSRFVIHLARGNDFDRERNLSQHVWKYIQDELLHNRDVHELEYGEIADKLARQRDIAAYTAARSALEGQEWHTTSAMYQAEQNGLAKISAIFGGQGNTRLYFDELRDLYHTYGPLVGDVIEYNSQLLETLASSTQISEQYPHGLGVLRWLDLPESSPSTEYFLSAPVSFPLIGLLQLVQFKAICMSLGLPPGVFIKRFQKLAGHSQGLIVTTLLYTVDTWDDFLDASKTALTILFWIGARSQQSFIQEPLLPEHVQQLQSDGHGVPSPMLSVSDITKQELKDALDAVNHDLPPDLHAYLSLANTHSSFVVSGPERTLAALILSLKSASQASKHNSGVISRFLPITIPCHSPLLDTAVPLLDVDLQGITIPDSVLKLAIDPAFEARLGEHEGLTKLTVVQHLVRKITSQPVHWPNASFEGVTHIIDFGPGVTGGIGRITLDTLLGSGSRIILAGRVRQGDESDLGCVSEIFQTDTNKIKWASTWERQFRPQLLGPESTASIETKLSRLLHVPPVLVAGMTPTTTHPDFVAAIMKAGYHAEFATGGYHNAQALRSAILQLQDIIPKGRVITVNIIYASPKALAWQIPLLRQLRDDGVPISGLTVGAGVPSLDIATEYITTLGLDHIAFKPSSAEAIHRVIDIARANPLFPVILQWTGGRGGGHHSSEDFHSPLLHTYPAIRSCTNINLVVGSGFGSAEDALPYFSGSWSLEHGKASRMPVDGILLGSRVMTCAEAHTSHGTKLAIAAAKGVDDNLWKGTYSGPTGGVISVVSEMGEPIHVIATRGALFWSELDKTIFSLERKKRLSALKAKKHHILSRLNADFQRPWFGRRTDGVPCEITDMTYEQVVRRLLELVYIDGWLDPSWEQLALDVVSRVEARLSTQDKSLIEAAVFHARPHTVIDKLVDQTPDFSAALFCTEDAHFFVQACRKGGTKPVPFIPILDDNFETWFKKDSLWQSENLHAVVEQDAGRTFILHGPVAARHTHSIDEPVAHVLDTLMQGVIEGISAERTSAGMSDTPTDADLNSPASSEIGQIVMPGDRSQLATALQRSDFDWATKLLGSEYLLRGQKRIKNPWKELLSSNDTLKVDIHGKTVRIFAEESQSPNVIIRKDDNRILADIRTEVTPSSEPIGVNFEYIYRQNAAHAPIEEVTEGRNGRLSDLYWQLWSCRTPSPTAKLSNTRQAVVTDDLIIERDRVQAFNNAIGYSASNESQAVTLDFALIAAWRAIAPLILRQRLDILSLVHLSNSFEVEEGARPLRLGEPLRTEARVTAVTPKYAGLELEIECELRHGETGEKRITIQSCFLFRDTSTKGLTAFRRKLLNPYEVDIRTASDIAVLDSKPWFQLASGSNIDDLTLTNLTLRFQLQQQQEDETTRTSGHVHVKSDAHTLTLFGSVEHITRGSHPDAVLSYLSRHGRDVSDGSTSFQTPPQEQDTLVHRSEFDIPASNEAYSRASGDFNPIHTSPIFAQIAGLPGTITHGMYCSAIVRQILEREVCGNNGERIREYAVNFVGMILPNARLEVSISFTGMKAGKKRYRIDVRDTDSETRVFSATAMVEQPTTTIVFTGQGSQEKGMGMDLYSSSAVARSTWDQAEAYFRSQFGLSILDIVRRNPKEVTVYFAGSRGKTLRRNYLSMQYELPSVTSDGKPEVRPMFPTIDERSTSFTHTSPTGLLYATQFAQPALAIMEAAAFRDLQAAGVVNQGFHFTGHSLGEYVALVCSTDCMSFENMLYVFFCRGMTMQSAVDRDQRGRSDYSMVAVDPTRVGKGFNESLLRKVISRIQSDAGLFIELVNLNVHNKQYVCAGDLRALELLQLICDNLKKRLVSDSGPPDAALDQVLEQTVSPNKIETTATKVSLTRGLATVPLPGIDVPFHSSYLRSRMEAFRRVLIGSLETHRLVPEELVGRYIPNVTGTPFRIDRDYLDDVWKATRSEKIADILNNWTQWTSAIAAESQDTIAQHTPLVSHVAV